MTELPPPGSSVRVTDPAALRALAHPLRTRLLGLLRLHGPATATLLAQRVGESSGATSYHLRELERYGFVTDLPGRGTARERWWQAAHRSTSWSTNDFAGADGEVAAELERRIIDLRGTMLGAWLAQRASLPAEWVGTASFNDLPLRLTPDQTAELAAELDEVLVRWRDGRQLPPGDPDAVVVQVFTELFPLSDYPL